jgi:TonB family protein
MPASEQRAARRVGDLGYTIVRCVVAVDGRCMRVTVLESSGNGRRDSAALRHAMRVWRFTPGALDGEPVAADYDLRITCRALD